MHLKQTQKFSDVRKLFNVIIYHLKKLSFETQKFIIQDLLRLNCSIMKQLDYQQILTFEIIRVLSKKEDIIMFWNIINIFDFLIIIKQTNNPIYIQNKFGTINKKLVEIYIDKYIQNNRIEEYIPRYDNHNLYKDNIMCVCNWKQKQIHQCLICEKYCHSKCLNSPGDNFVCPECVFSTFDPFYRPYKILTQPKLIQSNYSYSFKLPEICFKEKYFFVLKCMRVGLYSQTKYTDLNFPVKCKVYINDKLIQEYLPEEQNEPPRKDPPIILKISKNFKNIFQIGTNLLRFDFVLQCENYIDTQYIFATYASYKTTVQKIVKKTIKAQCINKFKEQEANNYFLKNFDKNIEYEQTKVKLDLSDPITQKVIQIPVRGLFCQHLNTFDLETYLKSFENVEYRKLICPLCKSLIGRLKIDFKTLSIIFEYCHLQQKGYKLLTEIIVYNNLQYQFIEEEQILKFQSLSSFNTIHGSSQIIDTQDITIKQKQPLEDFIKKQSYNEYLFDQQLIQNI